jgi:hypothetical protein
MPNGVSVIVCTVVITGLYVRHAHIEREPHESPDAGREFAVYRSCPRTTGGQKKMR